MFLLRLSGWLFTALLLATAAAAILGSRLPAIQTRTATRTLAATPAQLWPLLSTPDAQPRWHPGTTSTTPLPPRNDLPCWTALHGHLALPTCITAAVPPRTLTLSIPDPIPSTRTFTLTPASPSSTAVTLSETITTTQPLLRLRRHLLPSPALSPAYELAALDRLVTAP